MFSPQDQEANPLFAQDEEEQASVRPERVMIFTTITLLAILSVVTECFVDGTFKVFKFFILNFPLKLILNYKRLFLSVSHIMSCDLCSTNLNI